MNRALRASLMLLLAAALSQAPAHAEQRQRFGDYEVHYNAMPTDELLPEVARQNGIERSRKRGLLTLTVLRRERDGRAVPVKARLKAQVQLLTGQSSDIALRETVGGQAVYYLGEFRVMPPQTLRFAIEGRAPDGVSLRFDFSRDFF